MRNVGEIDGEEMIAMNNLAVGFMPTIVRSQSPGGQMMRYEWYGPEAAPVDTTLIAWGQGGLRFMRKDVWGQWHNMMGRAMDKPTFWTFAPSPPNAK